MHKFFNLPINNDYNENFWNLSSKDIKVLRQFIRNVLLIIIGIYFYLFWLKFNFKFFLYLDECSMISNIQLLEIHKRLEEIFYSNSNELTTFGNRNIILFGDLLQVFIFL